MAVRVGIDLVSVDSVRESVERHSDRYLNRVYTPEELSDCGSEGVVASQRLAARFAAKEAALKVLRAGDEAVPWRAVGVRRHPSGWVGLELSGRAAELAREAGVTEISLSLTHEAEYASAVVVAELAPRKEEP